MPLRVGVLREDPLDLGFVGVRLAEVRPPYGGRAVTRTTSFRRWFAFVRPHPLGERQSRMGSGEDVTCAPRSPSTGGEPQTFALLHSVDRGPNPLCAALDFALNLALSRAGARLDILEDSSLDLTVSDAVVVVVQPELKRRLIEVAGPPLEAGDVVASGLDEETVAGAVEVDPPADRRGLEDGAVPSPLTPVSLVRPGSVVDDEHGATGLVADVGLQLREDRRDVSSFSLTPARKL
jgi:hypothetical protein